MKICIFIWNETILYCISFQIRQKTIKSASRAVEALAVARRTSLAIQRALRATEKASVATETASISISCFVNRFTYNSIMIIIIKLIFITMYDVFQKPEL